MFIESLMPSSHLIFCCPLLLLSSIFSSIRVFFNKLALWIRWPKHWSFSISSSNEYSGLISFRIDWFGLLAVQGTLKSLLPYHIQNNCIAIVNNFVHSSLLLYEFIKAFLKAEGMRITVCLHLCYQKVLPTFSSNTKLWWINGTQCIFNLYSVSEVEHLFKELFLSFFFFLCTRSPFLNSYKDIGLFLCDLIGALYILGNLTLCNLSCIFPPSCYFVNI